MRYVAADDIALSPQRARDNAVVSFVVTGDAEQTGNFTEFHRYAHRLEQMAVEESWIFRPSFSRD